MIEIPDRCVGCPVLSACTDKDEALGGRIASIENTQTRVITTLAMVHDAGAQLDTDRNAIVDFAFSVTDMIQRDPSVAEMSFRDYLLTARDPDAVERLADQLDHPETLDDSLAVFVRDVLQGLDGMEARAEVNLPEAARLLEEISEVNDRDLEGIDSLKADQDKNRRMAQKVIAHCDKGVRTEKGFLSKKVAAKCGSSAMGILRRWRL